MLKGLQCGRAVAALMVAVFHANVFLLPRNFYDGAGAWDGFNFGYAGVEFFFVLSGFIMVLVHRRDFGHPDQAGRFLMKRVLRIYPIYWVVMAGLMAIYLSSPERGPDHARDAMAILGSFLLWPMREGPIMQVAWTLQHEMLFYLIFMLLILRLRIGLIVFGAWMLGCMVALPFWAELSYPFEFLFKPHNLLFLFGIISALVYERISKAGARRMFWLGAGLFLGLGLAETVGGLEPPLSLMPLGYGLGAALAVIGLARGDLPAPRWLTFLGDASYAIYLVHLPVMNIAAVPLRALGVQEMLSPLAMLALITIIVTVVGSLVHVYIENPLRNALQSRIQPKTAR